MPNVAKVFREEIARIARKEAKSAAALPRKRSARLQHTSAELGRRLAALEKAVKALGATLSKLQAAMPAPAVQEPVKARLSGKGIRSLRRKLRLSQAGFGALIGVTAHSVMNMEKKAGALKIRQKTRDALLSIRGLGAKEARSRIEEIGKGKGRRAQKGKGRKARGRRK